jgi:hypothetical protein
MHAGQTHIAQSGLQASGAAGSATAPRRHTRSIVRPGHRRSGAAGQPSDYVPAAPQRVLGDHQGPRHPPLAYYARWLFRGSLAGHQYTSSGV